MAVANNSNKPDLHVIILRDCSSFTKIEKLCPTLKTAEYLPLCRTPGLALITIPVYHARTRLFRLPLKNSGLSGACLQSRDIGIIGVSTRNLAEGRHIDASG